HALFGVKSHVTSQHEFRRCQRTREGLAGIGDRHSRGHPADIRGIYRQGITLDATGDVEPCLLACRTCLLASRCIVRATHLWEEHVAGGLAALLRHGLEAGEYSRLAGAQTYAGTVEESIAAIARIVGCRSRRRLGCSAGSCPSWRHANAVAVCKPRLA